MIDGPALDTGILRDRFGINNVPARLVDQCCSFHEHARHGLVPTAMAIELPNTPFVPWHSNEKPDTGSTPTRRSWKLDRIRFASIFPIGDGAVKACRIEIVDRELFERVDQPQTAKKNRQMISD